LAGESLDSGYNFRYQDWENQNYFTQGFVNIYPEFEEIGLEGDILEFGFDIDGGVYADFTNDGVNPIVSTNTGIKVYYTNEEGGENNHEIFTSDQSSYAHKLISINNNIGFVNTISGFKNIQFNLQFFGWAIFNPCILKDDPNDPGGFLLDYIDFENPVQFGRHRFALDGWRFRLDVNALVESKYWFAKSKSADNLNVVDGLKLLAQNFSNTQYTGSANGNISGAIFGEPVYYRDIVSQISKEFNLLISDENGYSNIVQKDAAFNQDFEINVSNVLKPLHSNLTFSETNSTEIYNEFVFRYAINHATKTYSKIITVNKDGWSVSKNVSFSQSEIDRLDDLVLLCKSSNDNFLEQIGIIKKTKTSTYNFVRDNTIISLAEFHVRNFTTKRALSQATVSKNIFLNAKIGDGVKLNVPNLVSFYNKNYKITDLKNGETTYKISLEEFI